jgi:hypothetical protein
LTGWNYYVVASRGRFGLQRHISEVGDVQVGNDDVSAAFDYAVLMIARLPPLLAQLLMPQTKESPG